MRALLGMTLKQMQEVAQIVGCPSFVAKQICDWIYSKNVSDIDQMSNISLKVRKVLSDNYYVGVTAYSKEVISKDGTRKYLFEYPATPTCDEKNSTQSTQNVLVEAVLIFDDKRTTLCISSQAGCKMNCKFCATGKMGFVRNLTANEIINIYTVLNKQCSVIQSNSKIDNIVFMGMGEPLDNMTEVQQSLEVLTSDWGYMLSPRRITVSTCGLLPKMQEFLDTTQVDIAISLHNPINEQRSQIMPVEKNYKIADVVSLLRRYDWSKQRHLTFEYVVLKNVNDSLTHVKAMARLLNGLPCRINLIPYNSIEDGEFEGLSQNDMQTFGGWLKSKGFNCTIRKSKGSDISAACGLLSAKNSQKMQKMSVK